MIGPPGNPEGIGAVVRLQSDGFTGPARELHAGTGVGSQDAAVVVLHLSSTLPAATRLLVRWPGGRSRSMPIPAGARALEVRMDSTSE